MMPGDQGTKPMVFFSHASADLERVELIAQHARAAGVEPYMAKHDPQPGRSLADKIVSAVENSDAVFVFLSQSGYDANYVQQEIGIAVAKEKVVVALVDPDLEMGSQDLALLEGAEFVPFSFVKPTIEGMVPLVAALQRITTGGESSRPTDVVQPGTLNVSVRAGLTLTTDDLMKGILVAVLVIGVIYLVSRPASG